MGLGVEYIIKNALLRRTLDNVTVVIVAFDNFFRNCFCQDKSIQSMGGTNMDNSRQEDVLNNSLKQSIAEKKRNPQMNITLSSVLVDKHRQFQMGH